MNPDLEKWIDEASKNLEPLAREKITEQITEHYEDSVAIYRSSGLSEVEACSSALEDLGKPSLARRKYRNTFLSLRTFVQLEKFVNSTNYVAVVNICLPVVSFAQIIFQVNILSESDSVLNAYYISFLASVIALYLIFRFRLRGEKLIVDYTNGLKHMANFSLHTAVMFSTTVLLGFRGLKNVDNLRERYSEELLKESESLDFEELLKDLESLEQARTAIISGRLMSVLACSIVLIWCVLFANLLTRRARALSK
jgi:hypothetical protein